MKLAVSIMTTILQQKDKQFAITGDLTYTVPYVTAKEAYLDQSKLFLHTSTKDE